MDDLFPIAVIRDELPDLEGSIVQVDEFHKIAVFRDGDQYFAIDNRCPHHSAPLADGAFDGEIVICPWHHFEVDVRTGACKTQGYDPQWVFPVTHRGKYLVLHYDRASADANTPPKFLAEIGIRDTTPSPN